MPDACYRLFCRASGAYYQQDSTTGTQVSLRTKDKHAAQEKLRTVNESLVQPRLNLDLARIYLRAHDDAIGQRTWAEVIKVYSERGRTSVANGRSPAITSTGCAGDCSSTPKPSTC